MIQLKNIEKQFGDKVIYGGANLTLTESEKYALVGRNGAGKSLLFRMLTGHEELDRGTLSIPPNLRMGYLPQEVEEYDREKTPLEITMEPYAAYLADEDVFSQIESEGGAENLERVSQYIENMERFDLYSLESRAAAILAGLGLTDEQIKNPLEELSGGFRMRVFLARLLLTDPDFILLDEPTNHLDMDSLIWLERFLRGFSGGFLIISHDIAFLNRVCRVTVEVYHKTFLSHKGSVTEYYAWKAEQQRLSEKRAENVQQKMEQLERFITRFKSKATKARQAQAKMKQLERLQEELPEEVVQEKRLSFRLPSPDDCGTVPIKLNNLSAGYDTTTVLDSVNITVGRGEKIAVIGPNGAGKSTFLKVCSGELPPQKGEVAYSSKARISLFNQYRVQELNPALSVYESVVAHTGENRPQEIRTLLGTFLFSGAEVDTPVSVLSGGEKSRLSLLLLLAKPGNVLLLDEPTNHLDIQGIESLATALHEYTGTVVLVSHNEYLIEAVADRIIEVRPGVVRDYPGNLHDYRYFVETTHKTDTSQKKQGGASSHSSENNSKQRRRELYEERKRLKGIIDRTERSISELEAQIEEINTILYADENSHAHTLLAEKQGEKLRVEENLAQEMDQWENAQEMFAEIEDALGQ
ncbi:ABC-F family ATP-binding cassette domain-containing protein [Chitinivibrio alkaliphilus]|uniref:ABC transport system, ATPase component n=1 Tax=Chitinivibrio alkaliphilus ACht1 TaxID=1313304 RepID=U7D9N7_9BACT|nr:ABC-F family ATP-binding cassette domain-containing protein [Chitinivibrio alkaliphilus]ERP31802.1 ABC transport system, ATPase component [Chitinivibrio alkaliphilus ACht1]